MNPPLQGRARREGHESEVRLPTISWNGPVGVFKMAREHCRRAVADNNWPTDREDRGSGVSAGGSGLRRVPPQVRRACRPEQADAEVHRFRLHHAPCGHRQGQGSGQGRFVEDGLVGCVVGLDQGRDHRQEEVVRPALLCHRFQGPLQLEAGDVERAREQVPEGCFWPRARSSMTWVGAPRLAWMPTRWMVSGPRPMLPKTSEVRRRLL